MTAILDAHGRPYTAHREVSSRRYAQQFHRHLRARYDAAQTTDENERHWANADFLSANAALRPAVRKRLRARARYEAQENNSYAKGMVLTLANDLVGSGPRLQLLTRDRESNTRVEQSFARWSREVNLAEKLRTLRVAKTVDGEAFALLGMNDGLAHDVKLDVSPVEADLFDHPYDWLTLRPESEEVDGVRFDRFGNPTEYYMLRSHPGSLYVLDGLQGDWIKAEHVLHVFRQDRPGQRRGVTEIATALPLFAMLRRFTLATIAAAETAADFAGVMHTQSCASDEAASLSEDEWFDAIPIEYRALLTLPDGWTMSQLKAEHPATTYQMFKREVINEIARCLNMPFNVAAANSAEYNYASGRLDHQVYFKSIAVEQHQWECRILDRLFRAWLDEAALIPGLLPMGVGPIGQWSWQWFWDRPEHVDPQKEANARSTNISSGTSHRAREYSRAGLDIDAEDEAAAAGYGVTVEDYRAALFHKHMTASAPAITQEPDEETADNREASRA